jgi:hypothetical protein
MGLRSNPSGAEAMKKEQAIMLIRASLAEKGGVE